MDKLNLEGIGERLKPVGERLRSGGERLKPVGERLRSGGTEMGRLVSGKMKEILQGPSQEAKMVDEATSNKLEQPNWGLNLKICALVNSEEFDGSQVVRAIKRKIAGRSVVSISLSLELLEVCAMNCDKVFSEIASEKLLDDMVRQIENPQMEYAIRKKALQLINAWGQSDDLAYLPVFKQTYIALKEKNMAEVIEQVERSAPHVSTSETSFVEDTAPFVPEWYGGGLTEEEKKEALVLARNSVDLLSSIVNSSDMKENPNQGNDLTASILEKCKEVQPLIKRIIESTADDEAMLFEAINLHDEIDAVLSKFGEITLDHPPETDAAPISNEPKATHGDEENNPPEEKGHLTPPDYTDSAAGSSAKDLVSCTLQEKPRFNILSGAFCNHTGSIPDSGFAPLGEWSPSVAMVSSTTSDEIEPSLNSPIHQEELKPFEKRALFELKERLEEAIVKNQLLKPRGGQNHDKRNSRVVAHPFSPENDEMCLISPRMNEDPNGYDFKLWEVPLLPSRGHESTDVILLKFLNAREFRVCDALDMIRNTLIWREEFGADEILNEEGLDVPELEKVTFMNGKDRSGQPVCYNMYGVFKDKELYTSTFGDEEKREKFVRWRVRCMEKGIRQLSFKSGEAESILQVIDLKDCLSHSMKEFRNTTKKVVSILQDNYPEFVSKNVS